MSENFKGKILSFINTTDWGVSFGLQVFEARNIIQGMKQRDPQSPAAMAFQRQALLSFLPLSAYLKGQESMGIYIDGEKPYIRFKLEMNAVGTFRTLLLSEKWTTVPQRIFGYVRTSKFNPASNIPYNSCLPLDGEELVGISNHLLKSSYQLESKLLVAENADRSILIHRLPSGSKSSEVCPGIDTFIQKYERELMDILLNDTSCDDVHDVQGKDWGSHFLMSREVYFHCPCSFQQMLQSLLSVGKPVLLDILDQDGKIVAKCDYCHQEYIFHSEDIPEVP